MKHIIVITWIAFLLCGMPSSDASAQDPFAAGVRPTPWLSPEEEQKSFQLPTGFEIQLVASEPEIAKPLNMAFDAKGRLWITNTLEYPNPAPPGRTGRDSIKVLEDTNGDGKADKITTFADGLNIPIGIYPYHDGVIAFSIPNIWHLQDTNGDGKADKRTKLYGPMGYDRDTHGLNNSFRRGFDGWLYACHGFNNQTTVKGTDGHTVTMQSGNTYRMRLDGSRIEQFTWGQVNPFGMAADPLGNLFTADCHSKPVYQLLRGGYYPSFGKPHDGLGFVPPMMNHTHGSTAISGIAVYTGENFPPEFRGNVFSGNVMTSRINRNSFIYHGSTILAKEESDFVVSKDPWFRPVDVQVGPDGALYVADFYNRIIGHYEVPLDHPGRDRSSGRIWRIIDTGKKTVVGRSPDRTTSPDKRETFGRSGGRVGRPAHNGGSAHNWKPAKMPADLTNASVSQLIAALDYPTLTQRTIAAGLLVDKFGKQATDAVREAFTNSQTDRQRSHLLWVLARLGACDETIIASAAADKNREVRIHAMKVLAEAPRWSDGQHQLALTGLSDTDAFVRRAAADALGQHPQFENIRPLLDTLESVPEADSHLQYTMRMAIRNQLRDDKVFTAVLKTSLNETDAKTMAGVAVAVKSIAAGSFLLKHVENHREQPATVSTYLQHAARYIPATETDRLAEFVRGRFRDDIDFQLTLLTSINSGLEQRGLPAGDSIKAWGADLAAQLLDSLDADSSQWGNTPLPNTLRPGNPWVLQKRASADGNRDGLFLCSLPRGEQLTGILRSADFEIPKTLSFYLAGHIGTPKLPVLAKNFVRLRDARTHELLAESKPPRHDVARKVTWDLKQHAGKRAYLEIVDGDSRRAFAWLAVGRFEPAVVALPKFSPSLVAQRQTSAAAIAAQLKLKDLQPRLARLVVMTNADVTARAVIAGALLAIHPDGRLAALIPAIGSPSIAADLRNQICRSFVDRNTMEVAKLLSEVMQSSPQRLQGQMADILAGDIIAAETLLKLVKEGHASARLLQRQTVRTKLLAIKLQNIEKRLTELTADIPSQNEILQKLIAERRLAFANASVSLENGAKVFTKNCAACHQLDGKGPLIGPQLDGIGGRGVERIFEDLIDPNRNVDVAFRSTNYVLENGMVKSGLFRRIDGATLVVADNKGKEFTIRKDEVAQEFKTNISLMPEDLPKAMTPEELYDLVAFLASKRTKKKSEE